MAKNVDHVTPEMFDRVERLAGILLLVRQDSKVRDNLVAHLIAKAVFDEDVYNAVVEAVEMKEVPDA